MISFQLQCKDFGYKEVVEYLKGTISKEEMIDKIKMETRRYAKRQITWFKKTEGANYLEVQEGIENNLCIIMDTLK